MWSRMNTYPTTEYRCACGQLLFKGVALMSKLDIKCRRCKTVTVVGHNRAADLRGIYYSIVVDRDLNICGVSDSCTDILGYTKDELLSMKAYQLSPLFSPQEAATRMQHVLKLAHLPIMFNSKHRTKDGTVFSVSVHMRGIGSLNNETVAFFFEKLPEPLPNTPHTQLNEYQHELLARVDEQGKVLYLTRGLLTLLQVDHFDVLGEHFCNLLPEEDRAPYISFFNDMVRTRRSFNIQSSVTDKTGTTHPMDMHFILSLHDDGHIRGYAVALRPRA